jgi:SLT domain-containing protein
MSHTTLNYRKANMINKILVEQHGGSYKAHTRLAWTLATYIETKEKNLRGLVVLQAKELAKAKDVHASLDKRLDNIFAKQYKTKAKKLSNEKIDSALITAELSDAIGFLQYHATMQACRGK